ncbi:MAG: helix-hairpin-helix domain-containing protein [Candidatus Fibromonas sp.]|jgi:competence protein ComEA|nr:helix-hairpin-helix domain-containing protein [Candidatus Fibromonas sp.]
MNAAEKKFLFLALFLFALGGVSRLGAFSKLSPLENILLPVNYETVIIDTAAVDTAAIDTLFEEQPKHQKAKAPKKKAPSFPIPINTASKEDLCFIKGVGPSLAQKIIDYRETKGSFRSGKDLEKVSGIGVKKRAAIEEFVKFD